MAMLRWRSAVVAVVAAAVVVMVAVAAAQAPAGAPTGGMGSECMNAVLNMSDCLSYVQSGSTVRKPDKPCCPELAGLVESNPVCLCQLLDGGAQSYGVSIDYTRALALPGICRLSTPPVSACAALGIPVHLGPSPAPMSGFPPSGAGPQLPENSPIASPPKANHALRRFTAGNLIALAALQLAAAAAGVF